MFSPDGEALIIFFFLLLNCADIPITHAPHEFSS